MFDLGRTLEAGDVPLPGAVETLDAVLHMTDASGVPAALTLVSDWTRPDDPEEAQRDRLEYYALLERIGLRTFFEPVERMVTISSEVGVFKPDPAIFRAALDKIVPGAPFSDALFITEKWEHVEEARDLGLSAIHFKAPGESSGEVDQLIDLIPLIQAFVEGTDTVA